MATGEALLITGHLFSPFRDWWIVISLFEILHSPAAFGVNDGITRRCLFPWVNTQK